MRVVVVAKKGLLELTICLLTHSTHSSRNLKSWLVSTPRISTTVLVDTDTLVSLTGKTLADSGSCKRRWS